MSEDLERIETWIGELAARLDPGARKKLARAIGVGLRRSQAARIARQENPDGSRYEPRKTDGGQAIRNRKGKVRRRAEKQKSGPMFRRLRRAAMLGARSTENEVDVGFRSPTTSRIARVHQEGLRDRVTRQSDSPVVKYPERILLGFSADDEGMIRDLVLEHLSHVP